jgi:hypothetical protein
VGVGLDYDIFLLTRVLEYRRAGLDEADSVVAGLSQTGHIITAAGVIMGIAFSGLLLSTETVLNQLAFLLVFAVLVDTFVVRSMLVPAIMSALGKLNWWPQKFKPVRKASGVRMRRLLLSYAVLCCAVLCIPSDLLGGSAGVATGFGVAGLAAFVVRVCWMGVGGGAWYLIQPRRCFCSPRTRLPGAFVCAGLGGQRLFLGSTALPTAVGPLCRGRRVARRKPYLLSTWYVSSFL